MPRMDGYQAARDLKADPALSAIPIVAVTAFAMVGDRDRVLKSGFDGYMPKPISPETFLGEIEAFLPATLRSSGVTPQSPQLPQPAEPRARATILVVDNSPANLQLAASSLGPFGYAVVTANNVEAALRVARAHPPDLILSDLHMPGQDGYDLIRIVKADETLRPIPFVFVSSTMAADRDRTFGLSLGAARFIVRPIDIDAFITEIDACLRERQQARTAP